MTSSRASDPTPAAAPRLRAFYARHPTGALRTSVLRAGSAVVVRAALFRADTDRRPAATALAAWRTSAAPTPDTTPDADDHALRRAESRAIHVVLGYLGFGEALAGDDDTPAPDDLPRDVGLANGLPNVPSAGRAPRLAVHVGPPRPADDPYDDATAPVRRAAPTTSNDVHPALRAHVADFEALIDVARHAGLRSRRAERWRARLHAVGDDTPEIRAALERAERRLRSWIVRRESLVAR